MRKLYLIVLFFWSAGILTAHAQDDSLSVGGRGSGKNHLTIGTQATFFRLNYYDPDFFNNPKFKFGVDLSFLYGRSFCTNWMFRTGGDLVFNQGRFILGINKDNKYINETFLRVPAIFLKKFPVECSNCILNPSAFVEFGGYASLSLYQSVYIQDAPTGLSSLDKRISMGYLKGGLMGGLGISFLSNNFGRHILGVRLYYDQWILSELKTVDFTPNYSAFCIYYNIANLGW